MAEPFIGEIRAVGFNYAPRGWTLCDGKLLQISEFQALYALLGTAFGGNGVSTFGVPDLRGRTLIGVGHGPVSSYNYLRGQMPGEERVTLTTSQMPMHTHAAVASGSGSAVLSAAAGDADSGDPSGKSLATNPKAGAFAANIYKDEAPTVPMQELPVSLDSVTVSVGESGGSQSHDNMQPSLAVYYIIAVDGLFPPRN